MTKLSSLVQRLLPQKQSQGFPWAEEYFCAVDGATQSVVMTGDDKLKIVENSALLLQGSTFVAGDGRAKLKLRKLSKMEMSA